MKGTITLKKCTFCLLVLLLAILASATVIEKVYGTDTALRQVYHSFWFVALWALFGISAFAYIIRRKLYGKPAVFLLHCAFGAILAGAFITFAGSERGYMHLRQGETYDYYISEKEEVQKSLPFEVKLVLFDIEYHAGTREPADYISFLKMDDEMCKISMNRIHKRDGYRFYQMDYDADEMGSVLLVTRDPFGIAVTYAGYLLLLIAGLWLLFLRIGRKGLLLVFVPTAAVWVFISRINPMTPILRTPMLAAHVSVIMVSYTLLLAMAVAGVAGLVSPALRDRMYRCNSVLLYPALFLLMAGIFIGAVWANISWGRYWGWDAKETWALITMLLYAIPLHKKSLPLFGEKKKFLLFCAVAFLTVVMTFLGVTFLLGGVHSYV
jgi:hypothetical protein